MALIRIRLNPYFVCAGRIRIVRMQGPRGSLSDSGPVIHEIEFNFHRQFSFVQVIMNIAGFKYERRGFKTSFISPTHLVTSVGEAAPRWRFTAVLPSLLKATQRLDDPFLV